MQRPGALFMQMPQIHIMKQIKNALHQFFISWKKNIYLYVLLKNNEVQPVHGA